MRLGLFGRVYAYSLAIILAYTIALIAISVSAREFDDAGKASARWLAADLLADCTDRPRLNRRVDALAATTPYRVAVACRGFPIVGTAGRVPLRVRDALSLAHEAALDDAMVFGGPDEHVLVRDTSSPWVGPSWRWIVLQLVVLAAVAWPIARSLTRPIARLRIAMTRFGAGDLEAKAGSDRRDELGDLARSFDGMAAHIAAQVRAEKLVVAGISHELRSPLHRITSALSALPHEPPGSTAELARREIIDDVREISTLLDDVFLLSRLEGPPATIERVVRRTAMTVGELIDDTTSGLAVLEPAHEVSVQLPEDVAARAIELDPRLAPRAVRNLIDNAIKYGAGTEIAVAARATGTELELSVTDGGPGIPDRLRDDVFRPFVRLGEPPNGVGLGLALARAIVRAHGGTLAAGQRSDGGSGARFVIVLPLAPR